MREWRLIWSKQKAEIQILITFKKLLAAQAVSAFDITTTHLKYIISKKDIAIIS
jgi:hypothetical protein